MEKVIGQSVERTNQVFLNRYDDDYNIIKNNIQPVEIPEPETV